MLSATQIGIMRDIADNKIDLDEISDWMRDQLKDLIFLPGPMLISTQGPSVVLTTAGQIALSVAEQKLRA